MADDYRDEIRQGIKATRAHIDSTRAQFEEANAKIAKKAGRNLFFALGMGILLAAAFLLTLFLSKPIFAIFVALFLLVSSIELSTAYKNSGRRVPVIGVTVSSILILAGAYFFGAMGSLAGLVFGLLLLTVWRLVEGLVPRWEVSAKTLTRDVFSGLFTLVYIAFLGSLPILLVTAERGQFWVFSLVTIVVSVDTGAYAAGVTLGKHKMTPRISPNKTWEGFAGAAVIGITVSILLTVFVLHQSWWVGLLMGAAVLITATLGDLTESLIKRNLGIKDMSSWIPGHGGFLDRLDSILPSTVPVYATAFFIGVL
ncbi:MAG TPA: phosphatidate cytidylyltransferase [Microbacteriaceae bacterium]|nr:phosphatidate cytidylyltransferase [Microbacteriaceae bacterium]